MPFATFMRFHIKGLCLIYLMTSLLVPSFVRAQTLTEVQHQYLKGHWQEAIKKANSIVKNSSISQKPENLEVLLSIAEDVLILRKPNVIQLYEFYDSISRHKSLPDYLKEGLQKKLDVYRPYASYFRSHPTWESRKKWIQSNLKVPEKTTPKSTGTRYLYLVVLSELKFENSTEFAKTSKLAETRQIIENQIMPAAQRDIKGEFSDEPEKE